MTVWNGTMPEKLIEAGRQGKGVTEFASEQGISRQTVYAWRDQHPTFAAALEMHGTHLQAWWEKAGREGMTSKDFRGDVWAKNMHNRFREDWRNGVDVDLGGEVTVNRIVRKIVDPAGGTGD